jgi:recombination protein RecA
MSADLTDKQKQLNLALSVIEKEFGEGSIMSLTADSLPNTTFITTGCPSLDLALGGGFPQGRMVEVYGAESSGKTTCTLHVIAEAQKKGLMCAFVDAEHALDIEYAKKLGIQPKLTLLSQPSSGEEALAIVETLVRSGAVGVIVIDSVAALAPRAEIEGEMGDSHMGLQARLMSQAMRKLTAITSASDTLVIFINQTRSKIGVVYGNPEVTSGGNALKFYAAQRVQLRRGTQVKDGEKIIGNEIVAKIVKNKIAPPFREANLRIIFGEGFDKNYDLLQVATEREIIKRSGAWYYHGEEKIGQGEDNALKYLASNPKVVSKIYNEIAKKNE